MNLLKKIFTVDNDTENAEGKTLIVNKQRCPQNHPCPAVQICPVGALTQKGYAAPTVDKDSCISCGKCVKYCPMRALSLS